jgi:hypothetical protein
MTREEVIEIRKSIKKSAPESLKVLQEQKQVFVAEVRKHDQQLADLIEGIVDANIVMFTTVGR